MTIFFTIHGACASMKNGKRLSVRGGKPHSVKSAACKAFEQDFGLQCPPSAKKHLTSDVEVSLDLFYPSRLQDLDGSIVYDLLQACGVVSNDRQVKVKHEHWHLDRENPRVVVRVTEI